MATNIFRSYNGEAVAAAFLSYPKLENTSGDMEDWVANPNNITLEQDGDFGLFSFEKEGIYTGHYLFTKARGKAAVTLARQMLELIFSDLYGAKIVTGITPADNRPALWMTRHLGFTVHKSIDIPEWGPCFISTITKDQLWAA
jgi:hypothetical protein